MPQDMSMTSDLWNRQLAWRSLKGNMQIYCRFPDSEKIPITKEIREALEHLEDYKTGLTVESIKALECLILGFFDIGKKIENIRTKEMAQETWDAFVTHGGDGAFRHRALDMAEQIGVEKEVFKPL